MARRIPCAYAKRALDSPNHRGGPIGLAIVQVLQARNRQSPPSHGPITQIVVSEVSSQRRAFAKTLGATHVFDPRTNDVVAELRALTDDLGADIAFECSGVQGGLDTAMAGIRVRGTVTIVSLWETKPVIDAFDVVSFEKQVVGAAINEEGDFEAVAKAIWEGESLLTLDTIYRYSPTDRRVL